MAYSGSYLGNPNVTITAIDVSGGIVTPRTTVQTPAMVHVSASAITAAGTSAPFSDLEFTWDFGDAGGTETTVDQYTGQTVNLNTSQSGGEAAYCFRTAGDKTVTLNIRGKNGSDFTSTSVQITIHVVAFNKSGGEWWFDSNGGAGTGADSSHTSNSLPTLASKCASNTQIWVKAGSSWTVTSGTAIFLSTVAINGLRISKYGVGANPVITATSTASGCIFLTNGNSGASYQKTDLVISGIDCVSQVPGAAGITVSRIFSPFDTTIINYIYLDNVNVTMDITSAGSGVAAITCLIYTNFGMWMGSLNATAGHLPTGFGFTGAVNEYLFFVGLSNINGPGANNSRDHHIYPDCRYHSLYSCINFGSGPGRTYCLNLNWDTVDPVNIHEDVHYVLITNCNITGTQNAYDAGNAHNDYSVFFYDFVVQQNRFHDLIHPGNVAHILVPLCQEHTMRDCLIWNNTVQFLVPNSPATCVFKTYRNKAYSNLLNATNFFIFIGQTWTAAMQFTDNILVSTYTLCQVAGMDTFANQTSLGSLVDRNQYWCPSDSDAKFLLDHTTARAFEPAATATTWQNAGFDLNGRVADPKWVDPGNGNFNPLGTRVPFGRLRLKA